MNRQELELQLADDVAAYYADPLGFVRFAYPWGERGTTLEQYDGPDKWQSEYLEQLGAEVRSRAFNGRDAVAPIRITRSSGHGIGKSTMAAWLVDWIMSTRPNCRGVVTANTFQQLTDKTWAAIARWTKLCITGHWFIVTGERMYQRRFPESWFCSAQTCREENSEAFAGQHAADSTSFYLFDEASAVPDAIYNVAEGGLTDGEPMIFLFGNPTRNTGRFYRATFGNEQHRWNHGCIDSRDAAMTNKAQIQEWIDDYGEDSDFVRVRVRGMAPRASELQFIDSDRVWAAQQRPTPKQLDDEPLIAGVDVSGGGAAWNVCRFRRGTDARSIPPIRIPGEHTRDRGVLVARLAEALRDPRPSHRIAAMFIDSAFGAAVAERLRALGFRNVHEVNFGGPSLDRHKANQRAYMWDKAKDWLLHGAIDPKDTKLETDLTGPGYHLNTRNQLVIESKEAMAKRGLASPDDGDALVLTFAQPVAPAPPKKPAPPRPVSAWS